MLHRSAGVISAAMGAVLCCCAAAWAADPVAAPSFGRKGTLKARVAPLLVTPEVLRTGVRVVARYGSFVVVEAPTDLVTPGTGVEILGDENRILLNAGAIDTTLPASRQLQQPRGALKSKALHLVQFAGPIQRAWLDELKKTGVEIVSYIPSNTYLVYGDAKALAAVHALSAAAPHMQWEAAYLDNYKIDPAAKNPGTADDKLYAIQLYADAQANKETLALIDRVKSGPTLQAYDILHYHNVVVSLPPAQVAAIAARQDVVTIQPYVMPEPFCERQDMIVAGQLSGNVPVLGNGYLDWLTNTNGFTQAQFDASNFVVDVSDSPVDNSSTSPNHFALWGQGIPGGASHVAYSREVSGTTVTTPPPWHGCDGHGNINAHIIGGYDASTNFPFTDSSGFHYGLGVCPFVRVGASVIFQPHPSGADTFLSPDYPTLMTNAYADNARISSNSWGANSPGYTVASQAYDALVRDAQSGAGGNQEMVLVFANGNSGPSNGTVGWPATAKNVISVGAAENVQPFGTDRCGYGNSASDSANDMATYSSRGPTSDGRHKPDLVAPGTHVSGGVPQANTNTTGTGTADSCFNGAEVCGGTGGSIYFPSSPTQRFYTSSTGTSHSAPAVAGGCALARQFFINNGLNPPSPAMTKAFLMNSARYLNGTGADDDLWSNSQGMGEMNLGEAFLRKSSNSILRDELAADLFSATGQTRTFIGNVADNTKPFRVTLAWTDAPGPTFGNAYLNDLNLTVQIGGNTYLGNVFSDRNSITGGSADAKNNVESVFLPAGVSGAFTVTVTAANINSDAVPGNGNPTDQDFAVVIYNATCPTIAISPASPLPDGTVGTSYSQTLVASGGTSPYTWTLTAGSLPVGLGLSTNGSLSGIPTVTGTASFTVQAADANSCTATMDYSVTMNCPTLGISLASPLPDGWVGTSYSRTLTASGGTAPYGWTLTVGPLPAGLDLSTNGVLSGTPTTNGTTTFTVQAADANSCTATMDYSVTMNTCPAIDIAPTSPLPDGTVGASYSQTLTASGGAAPYVWTLNGGFLPAGLSLSTNGVLSGTSTAAGTTIFTVQAADANSCAATMGYSVTMICPTIDISPTSPLPEGWVGVTYSQTLTASGGTAPYIWTLSLGALPPGLDLSTNGLLSGTPTAAGTTSFTVQAAAANSCTATMDYSVTMNACPEFNITPAPPLPEGTVGASYSQTLSATGGAPPYTWQVTAGALPAGLTLSLAGDLSGTPTAVGTFSFTTQTTDANGCTFSQAMDMSIAPCPHTGDVNGDTFVVGDDISGFVACLMSNSVAGGCAEADLNCDGVMDATDVTLFVAALLGP